MAKKTKPMTGIGTAGPYGSDIRKSTKKGSKK